MEHNKDLALKILAEKSAFVFCGGGVLGIAHAGALMRLYELGGLRNIKIVVGSSIGAVIAAALACGATPNYLKSKLFSLDFNPFKDGKVGMLLRFLFKYGLYKGYTLNNFIRQTIGELTGNPDITLSELYNKSGIHLIVTYLSLKHQETFYADHISNPDLSVSEVVKWSCTMPGFFKPNKIYDDYYVDGGTVDNYPLHTAREQGYQSVEIIGFNFYSNSDDSDSPVRVTKEIKNVIDFSTTLIEILRNQALRYHVKSGDWKLTCKINTGKYKSTDFNLTEEDKIYLYNSGQAAVDKHLAEIEDLLNKGEYF